MTSITRSLLSLLVCGTAALPLVSPAAEAQRAGSAPVLSQADATAEAKRFAEEGRVAMLRYRQSGNRDNQALLDAAKAYTEAHRLFVQVNDSEAVCEAQANLFWCKKQMNLEAVQGWLQQKGEPERQVAAKVDAVAERKVEASEVQAYFDRAERFARDHTGTKDLLQVSIRWFEVAERFAGSAPAVQAQRLSLAAQEAWLKSVQSAQQAARETRFMKPRVVVSGTQVAIPAAADIKAAVAEMRKTYAKAYARTTPPDKRRLARRLLEDAGKNKADAATYYGMLSETVRLAQEGDDVVVVLDAAEIIGDAFAGYDVAAEKKAALARMPNRGIASAVLTLIDEPRNANANSTAGRFFCCDLRRWDQGLPMLANGNDSDLAKASDRELDKPGDVPEFVATGDAWYTVGKRPGRSEERNAFLARAMHWYNQAIASLDGVAKMRIEQRLGEIDKTLPLDLDSIDWDALTPTQWDKLKGATVVVQARLDRTDPSFTLKPGDRYRLAPHPADTWRFSTGGARDVVAGWRGAPDHDAHGRGWRGYWSGDLVRSDLAPASLLVWLDKALPEIAPPTIQGPGRLFLCPNKPVGVGLATGQIRIKLIPLKDD